MQPWRNGIASRPQGRGVNQDAGKSNGQALDMQKRGQILDEARPEMLSTNDYTKR